METKSKVKSPALPSGRQKSNGFVFAVGRRRESVARVRLHEGKGEHSVNGMPLDEYFPGQVAKILFEHPFKVAGADGKYWVSVKVEGGGKSGQLDSVIHGVSRALAAADIKKYRIPLKKAGFLTRDPRIRERRKVGTGGKARRKKQSPKR